MVLAWNLAQFLPHPMTAITGWGSLLTGGGRVAFSWNLAEDPYWVPVLAAFDTAMPEGMTGFTAMLRWPRSNRWKTCKGCSPPPTVTRSRPGCTP